MAFTPKSQQQILGEMIANLKANANITDLNAGSVILTQLEGSASQDASQYIEMLKLVRNANLDTTEGDDLDAKAVDVMGESGGRILASKSSGYVTIGDNSFSKISVNCSSLYSGAVKGAQIVYVVSATNFPSSGSIIIGRNSDNSETVPYTSKTSNTFVLSAPLTKDHSNYEDVILSQGGNRLVKKGTIVKVPENDNNYEVNFSLQEDATLLDGEDSLANISIICEETGSKGNIGIGSISAFASEPFTGATVTNASTINNGLETETDFELRDRIRNYPLSLSRGTDLSIKNALVGLYSEEDSKKIISANIINTSETDQISKVYIDDGLGLEPSFADASEEVLIQSAQGQEQFLQLDNFPVVKAQISSLNAEPFNILVGDSLVIQSGDLFETFTFQYGDFATSGSALANEISKAINKRCSLLECRTFNNGSQISLRSKSDTLERLSVSVVSFATNGLMLSSGLKDTLKLYKIKNDGVSLLSKDGDTANVLSSVISGTINMNNQYNFWYKVDGKKTSQVDLRPVTSGGDYSGTYGSITAVGILELIDAINDTCPGIVANLAGSGTQINLISNFEFSSNSKIQVLDASSNNFNIAAPTGVGFPTTEVVGYANDYSLNKANGQIELTVPLTLGDKIEVGTSNTRAFVISSIFTSIDVTGGQFEIQDGLSASQIITYSPADFSNIAAATPSELVDVFNRDLTGFISYVNSAGNIVIQVSDYTSTNLIHVIDDAILGFSTTTKNNLEPNNAFVTSTATGPYPFLPTDNLIIISDSDVSNKTYNIPMGTQGEVTVGGSTTDFEAKFSLSGVNISNQFTNNLDLVGMYVFWTSGVNTGAVSTISAYDSVTNVVTIGAVTSMAAGDEFYLVPVTTKHLATYLNNSISSTFNVNGKFYELSDNTLQIVSNTVGTNGAVQVTGGSANNLMGFSTTQVVGSSGYSYYTGIVAKAQKIIDGLESNTNEYPGYRASGTQVLADTPILNYIPVDVSITMAGRSLSSAINEIKTAISNYINNLKTGQDVIVSDIITSVKSVSGVYDVSVTLPTSNVSILVNARAKVRKEDIGVG